MKKSTPSVTSNLVTLLTYAPGKPFTAFLMSAGHTAQDRGDPLDEPLQPGHAQRALAQPAPHALARTPGAKQAVTGARGWEDVRVCVGGGGEAGVGEQLALQLLWRPPPPWPNACEPRPSPPSVHLPTALMFAERNPVDCPLYSTVKTPDRVWPGYARSWRAWISLWPKGAGDGDGAGDGVVNGMPFCSSTTSALSALVPKSLLQAPGSARGQGHTTGRQGGSGQVRVHWRAGDEIVAGGSSGRGRAYAVFSARAG
jgi:hypothetical protein